ncbi:metallophosphoesterase (plasmid) [Phyllobacterium sp. 628]|uniref:metallophosphoesterase family protein n=1 Tax=Phyllobacterium sp. 628 TaxID=2718938 RepID=UPI0016622577|nr:metallophosphoesterase [Phyllobacterium sp. 628]QND55007.1 metallophosphoesterase [Phyllobacterium sp. 628]
MRIIQITDTHLSPSKPHFNANWSPLAQWVADQKPDLVIHTGDLSVDGADIEDDLAFSANLLNQLSVQVLCLPGNHDIGHMPGSAQPVNATRIDRWREMVGPDRWTYDTDKWRLIGLNSLILGNDSLEEEEQFDWLEDALGEAETRQIAIFAHKPLFVDAADEGETGYWSVRPTPRKRLLDLFEEYEVALHASGHLHRGWQGTHNNTGLVWAPASSFTVGDMERDMPGERILGAAIHTLTDRVKSEIVEIDALSRFVLDDVIEEVYPRAPKAQPAEITA